MKHIIFYFFLFLAVSENINGLICIKYFKDRLPYFKENVINANLWLNKYWYINILDVDYEDHHDSTETVIIITFEDCNMFNNYTSCKEYE